jgi:GNAT superfamily N-acetyltransferase
VDGAAAAEAGEGTLIELRPVDADADLAAWIDVHNRVSFVPSTAQEIAAYRDALEGGEIHLLALHDGGPGGVGYVAFEPEKLPRATAVAWIGVVPEARGRGVGSALYEGLSDWGRESGLERFEGYVEATEAEGLAWAARRGFEEIGRDTWLALDLRTDEVDPDLPDGVEIVVWADRPELARGLYGVACEAYPDVPGRRGDEMKSFEDWLALDMGGPGDRPEAVLAALADGEVVGYSKLHLSDARPTVAANDMTGVKRAWRGRGIAAALKRAQIAWARQHGYERLETANETRNEPIQRLNERLGYRPFSERVLLRGPLAPSP